MALLVETWAPGLDRSPEDFKQGQEWLHRSIKEHVEYWLSFIDRDLTQARDRFYALYWDDIELVRSLPVVRRLGGIYQCGIESNGAPESRLEYTRLDHTCSGAALWIVLGLMHGLEEDPRLKRAVVAMLLHDNGHLPFSHQTERKLVKLGFDDHEARGQRRLKTDIQLSAVLQEISVWPSNVIEIQQERGAFGGAQAVLDSLYISADNAMRGFPMRRGFSMEVVSSIKDLLPGGLLAVHSIDPIREQLEARLQAFREFYLSARNMICKAVLSELVGDLLERKVMTPSGYINGQDDAILGLLNDYVASEGSDFEKASWKLARGHPDDLGSVWRLEAFGTDHGFSEAVDGLNIVGTKFIACPYVDCNNKVVPVIGPNGSRIDIKAERTSDFPFDNLAFILVYGG